MGGLRLRMTAIAALAAVTLVGLEAAGSGTLATPPVASWHSAEAWYERVGAGSAAVVGLRLLAMLGVAWLLLGATLQLVASLSLRHGMQWLADAVSPLALRRLAQGVAGLSVTAGLAVPALPSRLVEDPPGTAVMQVLEDDAEPTTSSTAPTVPTSTSTTSTPTTAAPAPAPAPAPATTAPAAVPVPVVVAPMVDDEVSVEVGDSFWSLAVDALVDVRGSQPSDGEVVEYWQRLIEANRGRLVDPANPDLLFPGQTLLLPAP